MAQHIPIEKISLKSFRKIENGIKNDFEQNKFKGSLKYEKLLNIVGRQYIKEYQESPTDEVYTTNRFVGNIVMGGRGDFEIHFDSESKKLLNIYLVA